ncbi:type II toxin-antitoxin system HicB family antitoxin [Adlercreutzia sp. ZJ304]|uniref:type II toxin-antitoxin system HicB family antitoxin n=1 Tax=Adlercreutzia sp. ZJ304 TaxID=2709791 RepID=UPI001F14BF26|nr:type II toxin-antitoxin system HicB family antitoxin [Adlercreutzia sp. ZJ304]
MRILHTFLPICPNEDALLSARELLGCVIYGLEEDGEDIPEPTPLEAVEIEANDIRKLDALIASYVLS